jgi:hypothetical protein
MDNPNDFTDEERAEWRKAIDQMIMELWLKDKISSGVSADGEIVFWMTEAQIKDFEQNGVN